MRPFPGGDGRSASRGRSWSRRGEGEGGGLPLNVVPVGMNAKYSSVGTASTAAAGGKPAGPGAGSGCAMSMQGARTHVMGGELKTCGGCGKRA